MTRAKYIAETNELQELPGMEQPSHKPFEYPAVSYKHGQCVAMWEQYDDHLATLRTIPCSPECCGKWAEGQVLEEGRDYEIKGAGDWKWCYQLKGNVFAAPVVPVKSDDDLWKEVLTKIHMKALAYVSVGGHPHPGLPNHDPWHREMINKLKSEYIITKR